MSPEALEGQTVITKRTICGMINGPTSPLINNLNEVWLVTVGTKAILSNINSENHHAHALFEKVVVSQRFKCLQDTRALQAFYSAKAFHYAQSALAQCIRDNWDDLQMIHQVFFTPSVQFPIMHFVLA